MSYRYDPTNVFALILRGEIPSDVQAESEHSLVIKDVRPQAPCHLLAIPKGPYATFDHFMSEASPEEVTDFHALIQQVITELKLSHALGGGGYRLITNAGEDGFQEVGHFHVHVLAGRWLGPLLPDETDLETALSRFGPKLKNSDLTGQNNQE